MAEPRIHPLTMPKWGIEMEEGVLAEWFKAEGEDVAVGEPLCVIESDKIANEVEAEVAGRLRRRIAEVGESYPVGALLGVIAEPSVGEDEIDAFLAERGLAAPPSEAETTGAPEPEAAGSARASASARAGPAARRLAQELGVELAEVEGTGARGGITKDDVRRAAAAAGGKRIAIPDDLAISPAARRAAEALGIDPAGLAGSGRNGRITKQDVDLAARGRKPAGGGAPVSIAVTTADLEHIFASPMAKRLANRHGVDLAKLEGTGPRGRISKRDVLAAAGPEEAGYERVPLSTMRKTIARRLEEAKRDIPHFYLHADFEAEALLALRARANAAGGPKKSLTHLFIKAAAEALMRERGVNVQFVEGEIRRFHDADISVAVAVEDGLVTPVIRRANRKTLDEIAAEMDDLVERARAGKLTIDEYRGGSFSISNLGMYAVSGFEAVINPPQGAILALGAVRPAVVERGTGFAFARVVGASLSCDHRVIDGATGARFLAALKAILETPDILWKEDR